MRDGYGIHSDCPRCSPPPSSGAERIAAERRRQIDEEGYTANHDAGHRPREFAQAAVAYLTGDRRWWPWPGGFKHSYDGDTVRNLEKAGALVAAAIDRLTAKGSDTPGGLGDERRA